MTPDPDSGLGRLRVERKTGRERFHDGAQQLPFNLTSFWRWASSDLVSNATRGVVAEYVVAMSLGCDLSGVRDEWAPHDLVTPAGIRVEVKASAYLQSWHQERLSTPVFSIRPSRAWCADTNTWARESKRQTDVYVFALLAHRCKTTLDPTNVGQWDFYVVPTTVLNETCGDQRTLGLSALRRLVDRTSFVELSSAVLAAWRACRSPESAG